MANDRAPAPRPSRVTDDLSLGGLLDVLDRAEPLPARTWSRAGRAAPHRTGEGIGSRLVAHVLDHARTTGLRRISLETGSEDFFAPARRLYARHVFVECAPFGSYRPDPLSTFMTREV